MKSLLYIIIASAFLFSSCSSENPKANSSRLKRCIKKEGGKWRIAKLESERYAPEIHRKYIRTDVEENLGEFYFSKEDADGIAGDKGTWTPTGGKTNDIIYQLATPTYAGDVITLSIIHSINGGTSSDGYSVDGDYDRDNMIWRRVGKTVNDTVTDEIYYLERIK